MFDNSYLIAVLRFSNQHTIVPSAPDMYLAWHHQTSCQMRISLEPLIFFSPSHFISVFQKGVIHSRRPKTHRATIGPSTNQSNEMCSHISGIHLGCLWKCLNVAPIGPPSVQSSYQTCPLLEINSNWSEQGQVCWRPVRTVMGPDAYPRPHKTRACRFFWFPGYGLPL